MIGRFISDRTATAKLALPQKDVTTGLERMRLNIDTSHGGMAHLKGKIAAFPSLKRLRYCAILYSARSPFEPEVGRAFGISNVPVKRSDRRWLRFTSDPSTMYPGRFSCAAIGRTGGFEVKFSPVFLNDNLCENIVVIGRTDYLNAAPRKMRTFRFAKGEPKDETAFARYMQFLKANRAYLSDFALRSLIANPGVLLAADLAENCSLDFK